MKVEERVIIVDNENNEIDVVPRSVMRKQGLAHRATYVIITNSKEEILVQKRSNYKDVYPGYLDPTTGGVVRESETYEQNVIRELYEELGITNVIPNSLFDFHFEEGTYKVWGRAFWIKYDGEIMLIDGEVESYSFLQIDEIIEVVKNGKIMPDGKHVLMLFLDI